MEAVKVEPWMLKDFSEIEMEQIKKEAAKEGVFYSNDFIKWAVTDMPYLVEFIEQELRDVNRSSNT